MGTTLFLDFRAVFFRWFSPLFVFCIRDPFDAFHCGNARYARAILEQFQTSIDNGRRMGEHKDTCVYVNIRSVHFLLKKISEYGKNLLVRLRDSRLRIVNFFFSRLKFNYYTKFLIKLSKLNTWTIFLFFYFFPFVKYRWNFNDLGKLFHNVFNIHLATLFQSIRMKLLIMYFSSIFLLFAYRCIIIIGGGFSSIRLFCFSKE